MWRWLASSFSSGAFCVHAKKLVTRSTSTGLLRCIESILPLEDTSNGKDKPYKLPQPLVREESILKIRLRECKIRSRSSDLQPRSASSCQGLHVHLRLLWGLPSVFCRLWRRPKAEGAEPMRAVQPATRTKRSLVKRRSCQEAPWNMCQIALRARIRVCHIIR